MAAAPLAALMPAAAVPPDVLDLVMPMHAIIAATGHIRHAGPTLQKLRPGGGLTGARFLEVFEVRRPRKADYIRDLIDPAGMRLSLRVRSARDIRLKAVAAPLPDGSVLVNASFGVTLPEAIRAYGLCASDFAHTDSAIDLLYLSEAKTALTQQIRQSNHRLLSEKSTAERQAYTDTLTGLSNRRAMDMMLAQYRASKQSFALMHLDLDSFKAVNDTLGHDAGDAVLMQVGKVLRGITREEDTVVRTGGDEFVLFFDRLTNVQALAKLSERIIEQFEDPILYNGHECRVSCSIGITLSVDYTVMDAKQMMIDADAALYAAKRAGRATYRFVRDVGGVGQTMVPARGAG